MSSLLRSRLGGAVLLVLVAGLLLLPAGAVPTRARAGPVPHPVASAPVATAWDPLLGSPENGVPRYHVSTGYLGPTRHADYLGGTPVWLAYDAADRAFWIAALPNLVEAVPASSPMSTPVDVAVGEQPFGVAVDNASDLVYVTNTGSDNVTAVSDRTNATVGSVGVGTAPMGIAFDAADGELFVANSGSANVSVISTATLRVVATVAVGATPIGIAYDPATKEVFVADHDAYGVDVISTSTDSVLGVVPAGVGPYGVAIDTSRDNVYVSNEGSSNVSVIHAPSLRTVANIPVVTPGPTDLQGMAYDVQTDQVWVGAGGSYLVTLNASALAVAYVYSSDPSGVAYDPVSGMVCYTNAFNSTFECMTLALPTENTVRAAFDESGLPTGTLWRVSVFGGSGIETNGTQIVFWIGNVPPFSGQHTFVVSTAAGYAASPAVVTVDISTGPKLVNVTFGPGPPTYPLYLNASGLASGLGWNAVVNGTLEQTTGDSLEFLEPDGSYDFTLGHVSNYLATPENGTVAVLGASATRVVRFSTLTWALGFYETGLPAGTTWYVNLTSGPPGIALPPPQSSTTSAISVDLANGSYGYEVATADPSYTTPGVGQVVVAGSLPGVVYVDFSTVAFTVTFDESGLPLGSSWQVALRPLVNGSLSSSTTSTTSTLTFALPNGAYDYSVAPVSGYVASPVTGVVTVAGSDPPPVPVQFTSSASYGVSFVESGLAVGMGWSVSIGPQFRSGLTSTITLVEPNGTYGYVVQAVPGYATAYSGVVTVAGANATVPVRFSVQTFPAVLVEVGLPSGTPWGATIGNASTGVDVTETTSGSSLTFHLSNGTYTVFVLVPSGYDANLSISTLTVAGGPSVTPTVHFTPSALGVSSGPPLLYAWWALGGLSVVTAVLLGLLVRGRRRPPAPPTAAGTR